MKYTTTQVIELGQEATRERTNTHGTKLENFQCIADFWTTYLNSAASYCVEITPSDVAQMMVLMKIARTVTGTPVLDHYVDEVGYAGIAGELAGLEDN